MAAALHHDDRRTGQLAANEPALVRKSRGAWKSWNIAVSNCRRGCEIFRQLAEPSAENHRDFRLAVPMPANVIHGGSNAVGDGGTGSHRSATPSHPPARRERVSSNS